MRTTLAAAAILASLVPIARATEPYQIGGRFQSHVPAKKQATQICIPIPLGADLGRSLYAFPRLSDYYADDDARIDRLTAAVSTLAELIAAREAAAGGLSGAPGGSPPTLPPAAMPPATPPGSIPGGQPSSFLLKNCGACHVSKTPVDGGFDLRALSVQKMKRAAERIRDGSMPPAGPLEGLERMGTLDELIRLVQ